MSKRALSQSRPWFCRARSWLLALGVVGCGGGNLGPESGGGGGAGTAVGGAQGVPRGGSGALSASGGSAASTTGGGGSGFSMGGCASFTPCGGNPVGTWQIQSSCAVGLDSALSTALGPACADAMHLLAADHQGTLTLSADGIYSEQSTTDMEMESSFSLACVNAMAGSTLTAEQMPAFCSQYQTEMRASAQVTEANCAMSGEECVCNTVSHYQFAGSGTYTVSGATLTNDQGSSMSYCVQNGVLTTRETSDTLGDMFRTFQRMML